MQVLSHIRLFKKDQFRFIDIITALTPKLIEILAPDENSLFQTIHPLAIILTLAFILP